MRGKRLLRIGSIGLTIGTVAGCGGVMVVGSAIAPTPASPPSTSAPDVTASVGYCQQLDDGQWVTNDSPYSTTPCVPDPSNATGDEQADASVAVPRCFSCKLSDWDRAERRAARRRGLPTPASSSAGPATAGASLAGWSGDARNSFISGCAENMGAGVECDCLAGQLEQRVPSDQEQTLSDDDPRVQAAVESCRS
jgi:hypothetical protein